MADHTSIEWTDATWNPITGCSVVSPGCTNCYAMRLAGGRLQHHPTRAGLTQASKAGPVWTGEVRFNEAQLTEPLHWARPREIFVCAHGDLFHVEVPDAWIDRVIAVAALASHHIFQILTKRAARMREYFAGDWKARVVALLEELKPSSLWNGNVFQATHELGTNDCLPNVWLGVSAEDQPRWDERVGHLVQIPAAVRWVSAEPLLGPICAIASDFQLLHQVVVGGESGPQARPMHPAWALHFRDICAAYDTAFFFKQWGSWAPVEEEDLPAKFGPACDPFICMCSNGFVGSLSIESALMHGPSRRPECFPDSLGGDALCCSVTMKNVGKKAAGRLLDGVEHSGRPAAAEKRAA